MAAYYNENDPHAAKWLRGLIKRGLIAEGVVDERSIEQVQPNELMEFKQCHFFAGIGGWSYAMRICGWPDDEPVWTGSCPCQPFSASGRRGANNDKRHLWPEFRRLIAAQRPSIVFGEQTATSLGRQWLSDVRSDMEALGYAFGAADLCAASVGAPHARQRLYWGGLCRAPWPTPTAMDSKSSARHGYMKTGNPGTTLLDAARMCKQPRSELQQTLASGQTQTGFTAQMESGVVLNPAHSRWLLGFPAGWESCVDTETP